MLDAVVRPLKDAVLAPLAVAAARVPPLVITVAALACGLGAAAAAAAGAFRAGLLLWIANRVLDGLDGTVARRAGSQSDAGGYLDIVADFIVYAAVPLGIATGLAAAGTEVWAVTAFLLASFYVNAATWLYLSALLEKRRAGARATHEQTSVTMPDGLIAGTETALFFGLFLLLPARVQVLFPLMAGLVLVTAAQRMVTGLRRLR